jgi:tetratricopeptide (TPR) repeat protein
VNDRYPLRLGPFVVVARLIEEAVPEIGLAFSRRARRVRPCLLKHVRLAKSGSEDLQAAFQRASRLSRRLSHAGLARAFAVGRLEGRLFLAEAFRPGVLLSQLPPSPIPVPTAARIAREVAAALAFLHRFDEAGGLYHRRLSPEQVLLTFRGEVRLLDGPFSSSARSGDAPFARAMRPSLRYVPPEIAAGGTGDARSDLYMLGVLLWEMLSGRQHPAPAAAAPDLPAEVPPALRELIARLLAPDPSDRPSSAEDVRAVLSRFSPWWLAGRQAVARLIAGSVDVRQQLAQLRKWQDEARALLPRRTPAREGAPAAPRMSFQPRDLVSRRLLLPATLGAVGMMGLLLAWQPRDPESPEGAEAPVAVAAVTAQVAPAAPAPEAPAAAPEPVSPPDQPAPPPVARAAERPVLAAPELDVPRPRRPAARDQAEGRAHGEDLLQSAEVRFQWRDFEGAERLVREAMTELPRSPRPHYLLGLVLLARGEASEAATAFRRTIELEPDYSDAARKLKIAQERASIK